MNLLTLPLELRHQIYNHAFSNQTLYPIPPSSSSGTTNCTRCQSTLSAPLPGSLPQSNPFISSHLYTTHFRSLLTNKQFYTEASPVFFDTLSLRINDLSVLEKIQENAPLALRQKLRCVDLTVHLNVDTRVRWHGLLTNLPSKIFPGLKRLTVHNHMRSLTSYDRLMDAIYLTAPLVLPPFTTSPTFNHPPSSSTSSPSSPQPKPRTSLTLSFSYTHEEVMFESPLLGEITTSDSLDAHEQIIRDLMLDDEFRLYAAAAATSRAESLPPATSWTVTDAGFANVDFEAMTGRLLAVARGHEERWLEGLQRRRLGGLSVREVQERVLRGETNLAVGGEGAVGGGEVGWGDEDEEVGEGEEEEEEEEVWEE